MTIFGLFLYLQSTTEQRRGRLPYIVVSFAILFISSFSAGLDALVTFRSLYTSAGPQDYIRIITILENGWHRVASTFCANAYVLIGDAVLVSENKQARVKGVGHWDSLLPFDSSTDAT